jgi:ankyrin repeat and MYND domain-containing protein 2
VDFTDENGKYSLKSQIDRETERKFIFFFYANSKGMTPLQHSAYKGNKEAVQMLLDRGADVNSGKHEFSYTALHFGALSGNSDVCLQLLLAGADSTAKNSVGRTAAQMGAFVANHKAVSTINNFVSKSDVEYYTQSQGLENEPKLPPAILESFHKFIIHPNIHPIRIALNLQQYGIVSENYKTVESVLDLMAEREMKRKNDINELMAFKYHYLSWIVKEIIKCRDHFQARNSKTDYLEMFIKRVLKQNKEGQMDYVELTLRECVREFPFRECTIFQQVVRQLADKENQLTALEVLKQAINGQRSFQDLNLFCSTCGDEKPDKKCSKCKEVQYCDRECQRLHWPIHKKECARLSSTAQVPPANGKREISIDQAELSEELQKLVAG